jgi:hypothetical protein
LTFTQSDYQPRLPSRCSSALPPAADGRDSHPQRLGSSRETARLHHHDEHFQTFYWPSRLRDYCDFGNGVCCSHRFIETE